MEVHHQALAFKIRQQFGLKAQLGGWHNVREITAFFGHAAVGDTLSRS